MSEIGIAGDTLSGNISGVGNYTLEIIRQGAFESYNSTVYSKGPEGINPDIVDMDTSELTPPYPIRMSPEALGQAWWENITVGRAANADSVDLFFGPNYLQPLVYDGKSIVVVHDMIHEVCPEYLPRIYTVYLKTLLPYSVTRADRVITVSKSTKRDLMDEYLVSEGKIDVAYGAAADRFHQKGLRREETESVVSKYGLDEYILYVGNLEPRKNVHSIIEAVESVDPEVRSDVAIAGQEFQAYTALRRVYEESSIKDRIHFLGYVPDEDLPHLYAGAEVFVFPSFYEGFGLPVVEAMKTGTPVITSDRSSLPEVLGDVGATVNPDSVSDLANCIEEHLLASGSDEASTRLMKRANEFKWNESAKVINQALEEVLDG